MALASVVIVASLVGATEIVGNPSSAQDLTNAYSAAPRGMPDTTETAAAHPHAVRSSPDRRNEPAVADIGSSGAQLIIPSLDVDANLVPTGAIGAPGSASLIIPSDIQTVAWWDGSVRDGSRTVHEHAPRPGQPGVALIAGHVDSAAAGPGALFDLKALEVGAVVDIVDSDHRRSTWIVSSPPQTALKTALPPALWVTTGAPRLALVTCGGPFDATTGHYLDNVIVWARPDMRHSVGAPG